MDMKIKIPDYKPETGFQYVWEDNFEIKVQMTEHGMTILANTDGLISLARHFLNLAQDCFPPGYDLHLDDYNSLEEGSTELLIVKM